MRNHQQGMTFIGLLFVLAMAGVIVYAGIRLAPLYLNYMKVAKAMDEVATEIKGDNPDPGRHSRFDRSAFQQSRIRPAVHAQGYRDHQRRRRRADARCLRRFCALCRQCVAQRALRKDSEGAVIPLRKPDDLADWVERSFGHVFGAPALCAAALTHRSAGADHNERLEFLGDSILNCAVARLLYDAHPQADEGALSRLRASLVSGESLAQIAADLGLGEYLRLGAGELKTGGFRRASILADALEAMVGAIFWMAGSRRRPRRSALLVGAKMSRAAGGGNAQGSEDPAAGDDAGARSGVAGLYPDGGRRRSACAILRRDVRGPRVRHRRTRPRAPAGAAPSNWPPPRCIDLLPPPCGIQPAMSEPNFRAGTWPSSAAPTSANRRWSTRWLAAR